MRKWIHRRRVIAKVLTGLVGADWGPGDCICITINSAGDTHVATPPHAARHRGKVRVGLTGDASQVI